MMLKSKRCIIRPFEEQDIEDFMTYRNDMDWMRYQGFKGKTKKEYIDILINLSLNDGIQLAVISKKTNGLIGDIYLKQENLTYWIGYTICRDYSRQGYAYEVVSTIIEMLKRKGVLCIKAGVVPNNTASIALLKKLNFSYLESDNDEYIFTLDLCAT